MNIPGKGILGVRGMGAGPSVVGGQGQIQLPGQQSPTAAPPVQQVAPPEAPVPGVSGITPGAIERRLSGVMSIPPTNQVNPSMGQPPSVQLQNSVGADPSSIQDPIALIRALLNQQG